LESGFMVVLLSVTGTTLSLSVDSSRSRNLSRLSIEILSTKERCSMLRFVSKHGGESDEVEGSCVSPGLVLVAWQMKIL
jgi:hypothetical protein